jgi:prepilin-type processing-associated H-X9-DG protein
MARHHAQNRPEERGFLYADGHVRVYQGTRKVQKAYVARLRFPAPATLQTWVSDAAGDPALVVMAEPSASLASELRRLIPELRAIAGPAGRSPSGSTGAAGPRPCSPT